MDDYTIKDSGERQAFSTGAQRDTAKGKGRPSLISPFFIRRLSQQLERGMDKYGERNWEKGMPQSRFWDSADRHGKAYQEGDRSEDHLAAWAFNVMAMVHQEEMIARGLLPAELNDMPNYMPKEV